VSVAAGATSKTTTLHIDESEKGSVARRAETCDQVTYGPQGNQINGCSKLAKNKKSKADRDRQIPQKKTNTTRAVIHNQCVAGKVKKPPYLVQITEIQTS